MNSNDHSIQMALLQVSERLTEAQKAGAAHAGLKGETVRLIRALRSAMFPGIFDESIRTGDLDPIAIQRSLLDAFEMMRNILSRLITPGAAYEAMALELIQALPAIRADLETDLQAAYEGDPAATGTEEILLAYPAFEAISIYRIAHKLYLMRVPILPRMMTEYAHQLTGIDIHPGASIGRYFFIDHGTGVVIGETSTIGEHVKLYQGVTLGARSFELGPDGNPVKGVKRHPNIGDYVVIYSGATILGGSTVIGDHCVIGGNVWLTHSVPAGETVLAPHGQAQRLEI